MQPRFEICIRIFWSGFYITKHIMYASLVKLSGYEENSKKEILTK